MTYQKSAHLVSLTVDPCQPNSSFHRRRLYGNFSTSPEPQGKKETCKQTSEKVSLCSLLWRIGEDPSVGSFFNTIPWSNGIRPHRRGNFWNRQILGRSYKRSSWVADLWMLCLRNPIQMCNWRSCNPLYNLQKFNQREDMIPTRFLARLVQRGSLREAVLG